MASDNLMSAGWSLFSNWSLPESLSILSIPDGAIVRSSKGGSLREMNRESRPVRFYEDTNLNYQKLCVPDWSFCRSDANTKNLGVGGGGRKKGRGARRTFEGLKIAGGPWKRVKLASGTIVLPSRRGFFSVFP